MSGMQIGIVALALVWSIWAVLRSPGHGSAAAAVSSSVVVAVFIPYDVSSMNEILVSLAILTLLLVGAYRSQLHLRLAPFAMVILLVYMASVNVVFDATLKSLAAQVAFVGTMGLLLSVSAAIGMEAVWAVARVAPMIIVVELIFAMNEVLLGGEAPWPRRDQTTYSVEGTNHLLDGFDVRAMGTTGYVITLGILMACLLVLCVWVYADSRKKRYLLFAALAAGVIGLSGTRTAAIASLVGILVLIVLRWKIGSILSTLLVLPLAFVTSDRRAVLELLGFGEQITDTRSYEHRFGLLENASSLLTLPSDELVFGNGETGAKELVSSGFLGGVAEVGTFDNQYIRMAATFGLIGLALTVIILLTAMVRGPRIVQAVVACLAVSMGAYDVLSWMSLFVVFTIFVAATGAGKSKRDRAVDVEGRMEKTVLSEPHDENLREG